MTNCVTGVGYYGWLRFVHDVGHLRLSYTAEKELLPKGWDHEKLTRKIVSSDADVELPKFHYPAAPNMRTLTNWQSARRMQRTWSLRTQKQSWPKS